MQIALVSQEPVLFGRSIRENIAYGRDGVSDDDIKHAAVVANAHDFIADTAEGYETQVGEKGVQLSGIGVFPFFRPA